MYFVYLLQSLEDGSFYIGYTDDVYGRLKEHNSGRVYYTKRKMPWMVVYYEAYLTMDTAREREIQLKRFGSAYTALLKRLGLK